ncbi:peptide ABC transporter substrate-binding protein [Gammaproteobacteria bacterium]|jgi:oligopeptide transport system substrate-binding protein|nr:peptide ABC transporter substrate-binding protein [Gammaproteobacteria bacterium]
MTKKINILSITLIFLIGCSENISPVDSGLEQQIYHHGNGSEPQGIDPHIVTGVPEHHILISLCEGLTIPNPNPKGSDGYIPGTAESWSISDDGKEYIFKLNKNAKWSNGDPVTADDFVWSWKRILTASLGSQYPDMLYYLVGAYEYHNGQIDNFDEVGVKAIDTHTLKVNLKNPTPFFIGLLSHYSTWPVHKETVLKHGDIDDRNGEWTRPGNFVCNGPFQLKTWELNNKIVVEKNPHYYDASMVRLNEIHYYPVSNVMTEDRMFRAGQLHLTSSMPTQKCPIYIEEKNPNLKIDPYMGTYFYRINTENETLNDVRVRKALAYSIDRQLLVDKVTQCGQIPAYSFTPPGSNGYQPSTEIPYDPVLAKQLLAEAGYSSDNPFPKLEILFNTNEGHRKVALAIQQMWQNELGIEVELVNQDWKVYLSREMVGDFQISRAGWIGDYEDPNTFLDLMRPNRGNNKTGWENMEFDALVEEANTINDQEKRYELLNEAEKILIDNMPIIPLYTYVRVYQLSPDVKGFNPHILDHHHPKFIYLERD